ncbi:hypothetical protein CGZ93_11905 [Enemella dayhoffiae]|uniref:Uncharacterized protein n=1 Tax=Enemella dayhoffiae TaxID=2016507 RepID=A0A255GZ09_9ACTN|nr:hypothetical protein CGZ93_11905 [Enemella dayhoffiae]
MCGRCVRQVRSRRQVCAQVLPITLVDDGGVAVDDEVQRGIGRRGDGAVVIGDGNDFSSGEAVMGDFGQGCAR